MTQHTRSIDFSTLTLRDALDLASLIEEEARDRYEELADQMEKHNNIEVAKFFRFMVVVEARHEVALSERRSKLFGDEPRRVKREMIFDIEAPEYDELRANTNVRQALEIALTAEKKAFEFFHAAAGAVQLAPVRDLLVELRDQEREHRRLVQAEIDKLPAEAGRPIDDSDDEIVAH